MRDRAAIVDWADRFAILADPSRLTLLLCIRHAGRICLSDLAVAAGLKDITVSQALRFLRAHHLVAAHRDGRLVRYELADDSLHELLDQISTHGRLTPEP